MESYIPIIGICFGAIFAVAGFVIFKKDRKIRAEGTKTLGTVVDVQEEYSSDGTSYRLTVEFKDRNGKLIRQALDYTTGFKPKQSIPYKTPIYYLQDKNQTKIALANSKAMLFMGIAFLVIGIMIMGGFIISLIL